MLYIRYLMIKFCFELYIHQHLQWCWTGHRTLLCLSQMMPNLTALSVDHLLQPSHGSGSYKAVSFSAYLSQGSTPYLQNLEGTTEPAICQSPMSHFQIEESMSVRQDVMGALLPSQLTSLSLVSYPSLSSALRHILYLIMLIFFPDRATKTSIEF